MKKQIFAAALCIALAAHSQDAREQAKAAGIADAATTVLGLAAGAVELNPLGPLVSLGLKPLMFQYAERQPELERPAIYAAAASMWSAASANNLCVLASIATGGAFAPACLAVGFLWGVKKWNDTEHERTFWAWCAGVREFANQPDLVCIYVPPGMEVETVLVQEQ